MRFPLYRFEELKKTEIHAEIMKIFERFGSQIKKLSTALLYIDFNDILMLLSLTKNLEELYIFNMIPLTASDAIADRTPVTPAERKIIHLPRLKCLHANNNLSNDALLKALACPILEELRSISSFDFISRHTHLKRLEIIDGFRSFDEAENLLLIPGLKLSSLDLSRVPEPYTQTFPEVWSSLTNQMELKTLKLQLNAFMNDQVVRSIKMLPKLESLSCKLNKPVNCIADILSMRSLRALHIFTYKLEHLKPLSEVHNQLIEELSLHIRNSEVSGAEQTILRAFTRNLPKLKKATFCDFAVNPVLEMALQLKNLEFLEISSSSPDLSKVEDFDLSITNANIRELTLKIHSRDRVKVSKICAKMMPNIMNFKNLNTFSRSGRSETVDIQLFPNLIEFESHAEFLSHPGMVASINRHENLKKVIVLSPVVIDYCDKQNYVLLSRHYWNIFYGSKFPCQKLDSSSSSYTLTRI